MWLRVGKRGRWQSRDAGGQWRNGNSDNLDDVTAAANDLTLRENEIGLSVYRVENARQGRRVAAAHALTQRDGPDRIDFVLIPNRVLAAADLNPVFTPSNKLPGYLRVKHYEIPGLDSVDKRNEVARGALGHRHLGVARLSKNDIKKLAKRKKYGVLDEPEVRGAVQRGWWSYLNK